LSSLNHIKKYLLKLNISTIYLRWSLVGRQEIFCDEAKVYTYFIDLVLFIVSLKTKIAGRPTTIWLWLGLVLFKLRNLVEQKLERNKEDDETSCCQSCVQAQRVTVHKSQSGCWGAPAVSWVGSGGAAAAAPADPPPVRPSLSLSLCARRSSNKARANLKSFLHFYYWYIYVVRSKGKAFTCLFLVFKYIVFWAFVPAVVTSKLRKPADKTYNRPHPSFNYVWNKSNPTPFIQSLFM
jgi:hypothetical protein